MKPLTLILLVACVGLAAFMLGKQRRTPARSVQIPPSEATMASVQARLDQSPALLEIARKEGRDLRAFGVPPPAHIYADQPNLRAALMEGYRGQ